MMKARGGCPGPGSLLGRKVPTPTSTHSAEGELRVEVTRALEFFVTERVSSLCVVSRDLEVHWADLPVLVSLRASHEAAVR